MQGKAKLRIYNLKKTSSPRVGPKQLCASAHLVCTHAVGTSQYYLHTKQPVIFTTPHINRAIILYFVQTTNFWVSPDFFPSFSIEYLQIFVLSTYYNDCTRKISLNMNVYSSLMDLSNKTRFSLLIVSRLIDRSKYSRLVLFIQKHVFFPKYLNIFDTNSSHNQIIQTETS